MNSKRCMSSSIAAEDFIGKEALQKQKELGVTKQLVFFHLNNIDPDVDIWPWGGEPIYRNEEFVGTVTSAGYGFSADKLICLGFIHRPESAKAKVVSTDYLLSNDALYEVDIAGTRFIASPYLYAPNVAISLDQSKKYRPTVISYKSDISR